MPLQLPRFKITPQFLALVYERLKNYPHGRGAYGQPGAPVPFIGGAGEIATEILRQAPLCHVGLKTHDWELYGSRLTIEGKAQMCETEPRWRYEVNVADNRFDYQVVGAYIFTRVHYTGDFKRIEDYDFVDVCGWCTREELLRLGRHHNKGDPMGNGRPFTQSCQSIRIEHLHPVRQLWDQCRLLDLRALSRRVA